MRIGTLRHDVGIANGVAENLSSGLVWMRDDRTWPMAEARAKKLRHQGTVLAHTFRDRQGRYHNFDEVECRVDVAVLKSTAELLDVSSSKMSKSMLNGVNPDDVVALHGADALRLYEMFMGDFEQIKPWDPRAIEGMSRFLRRVWRLVEKTATCDASPDPELRLRHKTIKKVTTDL